MRSLALLAIVLTAASASAQSRGVVTAIQVSDARVTAGTAVKMTITGSNPCGAVFIDQQDGSAVTYPIYQLPTTIPYTYTKPGAYRIVARGMGNCDGEAVAAITVLHPPTPPPPPPPAAPSEPHQMVHRFKEMDRDGDGVITRAEWRGSPEAFRAADRNGDGVLSGEEVRARRVGTPAQVVVDARERWTDTGLNVREGDLVTFETSGRTQLSTKPDDVAGPGGTASRRRAPDAPLPEQPAGALIGRIGNSLPFFIGGRSSVVAPASGRLFLAVNDDFVADNKGEYRVTVVIER